MTTLRATLVLCLLASACGTARKVEERKPGDCPNWRDDIQALVQPCTGCHEELKSYDGALALRDKMVLLAADGDHAGFTDELATLKTWAGDCEVPFVHAAVHENGIMNPASADFHGNVAKSIGFDLKSCASCHGDDWKGGITGESCTSCHTEPGGPTACSTCHATPPASGAHIAHVTSPNLGKPQQCSACHVVPEVYSAAGHVTLANGKPDTNLDQADVTFGALAATATPARRGVPSHDFAAGTCSNVYCHGDAFTASGAIHPQPTWTGGPAQGECGSCHGAPPAGSHPADPDCARCHTDKTIAAHLNGKVDLGVEAAGCNGCHGGVGSPNPLSGAHLSHTEALHGLSGKIACESCHVVPTTLTATGHLDAAPAEVALKGGGTFSGGDKSCAGVGCHGDVAVTWTAGPSAAACGSCHGIPPNNGAHFSTLKLTDCVNCHANTVDAFGNIKITAGVSAHINGRNDIAAP